MDGYDHEKAVLACNTLKWNRRHWKMRLGWRLGMLLYFWYGNLGGYPSWLCDRGFGVCINGRYYITTKRKGHNSATTIFFHEA